MGITSIAVRLMLGTAALAVLAVPVRAAPSYYAILESDTDSAGGQEVFAVTYDTFSDFLGDNQAGGSFSTLNINSAYSLGGFTYDGQYRLLLETNADSAGGLEVFALTYDAIADLLSDNQAGGSFSTLNINSAYSLGGFAYDGQYRLLLETNADSAGGLEVFVLTYATFADLLSDNQASGSFSTLNINSAYSLGGFTYDGQYRLLLESNADSAGGQEVFAVTYDTIADLLADNQVGGSFSTLNINSAYSLGGFSSDFLPPGDGGGSVPEPPTSLLLLLALGVLRRIYRHGVSA